MNRYKGINPEIVFPASRDPEPVDGGFDGGIVLLQSPQTIELNQSPSLERVRIEQGGLRQDYGTEVRGTATPRKILALGEHRFVVIDDQVFEGVYRVYRKLDGFIRIEVWNGTAWEISIDSATIGLAEVLLGHLSFFDAVFLADGEKVLRWQRSLTFTDQSADFPSLNSLEAVDDTTSVALVPAGAHLRVYSFNFSARIQGPSGTSGSFEVSVEHDGVEFGSFIVAVPPNSYALNSETWEQLQIINALKTIASGESVSLKLKAITHDGVKQQTNDFVDGGAVTPKYRVQSFLLPPGDGTQAALVVEDKLTWEFTLDHESGTFGIPLEPLVSFWVDLGSGWAKIHEENIRHQWGTIKKELVVPGFGHGHHLGIQVEPGSNPERFTIAGRVSLKASFKVYVKGFNQTTDDDPEPGVVYKTASGVSNDLEAIQLDLEDVPGRFVGTFINRLFVLRKDKDLQKIACSVNGDPMDLTGLGSDEVVLAGQGDPIDALMHLEELSSNIAVLFRARSIMRVTATGRAEAPAAYTPWIKGIGTESPFTIKKVPGGLIFLSHDRMVYLLNEGGPQPIGAAIQEELQKSTIDPLTIEGVYDDISSYYTLVFGDTLWLYDLRRKIWYRRTATITRPAFVGGKEILYAGSDNLVRAFDKDGVAPGAFWVSPTLNRGNRQAEYTLTRIVLRYRSEAPTTIFVEASGDGGETWKAGFKTSIPLSQTGKEIRRAVQGLNVTGYDLRFRIRFGEDVKVHLMDWRAEIMPRGQLGGE